MSFTNPLNWPRWQITQGTSTFKVYAPDEAGAIERGSRAGFNQPGNTVEQIPCETFRSEPMDHTNCNCAECQRLDALPVRRHGIPHARQTTFIGSHDPRPIDWPEVEPYQPIGPNRGRSVDDLPLFSGGLQPVLF